MKKTLRIVLNILPVFLIVAGISLAARAVYASKAIPPVVSEMSKDIRVAQQYVKDVQPKVDDAKLKANVYRSAICATFKEFCTKEYLDPLNSGVDLSSFLASAAK